jgi:hypothetical protein
MLIQLWSYDNRLMHEVEIPSSIVPLPVVLIWGDKAFVRNWFGNFHEAPAYVIPTVGPS